jgi:hypothetical protein
MKFKRLRGAPPNNPEVQAAQFRGAVSQAVSLASSNLFGENRIYNLDMIIPDAQSMGRRPDQLTPCPDISCSERSFFCSARLLWLEDFEP